MNTDWVDVLMLVFIIILWTALVGIASYDAGKATHRETVKQWAIEHEYAQYHPKTGEFQILNDEIKPLLKKED